MGENCILTKNNEKINLISRLGKIRFETKALSYGEYKELILTNGQYAFSRNYNGKSVLVTVNNDDNDFMMNLPSSDVKEYVGGLFGERVPVKDGHIFVNVKANSGEIWLPVDISCEEIKPIEIHIEENKEMVNSEETVEISTPAEDTVKIEKIVFKQNKTFEEMTIEELQEAILERMKRNGPVTERMKKDVLENIYHDSLVTWIKSFN